MLEDRKHFVPRRALSRIHEHHQLRRSTGDDGHARCHPGQVSHVACGASEVPHALFFGDLPDALRRPPSLEAQ